MALQGKYNFKGIELDEAYLKITSVSHSYSENKTEQIKTPSVFNEDGSIKTNEVRETVVEKKNNGSFIAKVYKNKESRDDNHVNNIDEIHGVFDLAVNATAKNNLIQAYVVLKAMDAYKDYTDV